MSSTCAPPTYPCLLFRVITGQDSALIAEVAGQHLRSGQDNIMMDSSNAGAAAG